jgi:ubiquinol-cytochrome c reductase cytochrome b subunit
MINWLDERLHVTELMNSLFKHPVPKRSNIMDYLGFATLFAFINQVITGILLATVYKPSATEAYTSIKTLQSSAIGHYVRSLHSWGANFMVVLIVLHLLRVFYEGSYKKPRELTWIMGGILLIATLGLAFTGYLLPWDQAGYWATTVGTAMAGYVPGIGGFLLRFMRDGSSVSGATLTRFYALHILVLPLLILLAFFAHFFFVLRQGMAVTDELSEAQAKGEDIHQKSIPFWPNVAFRMISLVLIVAVAMWILATVYPKGLTGPADPINKAHFVPEPAWYFFGVYQLLKYFHGPLLDSLGMVGLPIIGMIILFGLPWIDRNPHRQARKRPIGVSIAAVAVIAMIFLTYQGMNSVPKVLASTGTVEHPSFKHNILPIINSNCSSCHSGFTSYSGFIQNVTPGNPDKSVVVQHLTGELQPQMPFGQAPLNKNQIQTVKNWIKDGAKDN